MLRVKEKYLRNGFNFGAIRFQINPSLFGLKSFAYRVRQYVFKSDCVEGAHPLVKDVETPREILFMFDPITYSKGKPQTCPLSLCNGPFNCVEEALDFD